MRLPILILTSMLTLWVQPVTANENEPLAVIHELFAALSAQDEQRLLSTMTDDFHLLEVGEIWDRKKLLSVMAGLDPSLQRRNWFSPIRVETRGDTAWISYWNRATYQSADRQDSRAWLESAVLVRAHGRWRIQMLHSTRLDGDTIPEGVKMVEHRD